jgi:hypothetical protein
LGATCERVTNLVTAIGETAAAHPEARAIGFREREISDEQF